MTGEGLRCIDVVELLTDYLEGALDPDTAAAVEAHLDRCPPCVTYLDQLRATVAALGRVGAASLPPESVRELQAAFAGLRRPGPAPG